MTEQINTVLSNAVAYLSKAIREGNSKDFFDAAESLLTVYDKGRVTRQFSTVILLYSALAYEIANEPVRSLNPYTKIASSSILPVADSVKHESILKLFNKFCYDFGRRDISSGLEMGNSIFSKIKLLHRENDIRFSDQNDDEVLTFLGIIESMYSYLEITQKQNVNELSELASYMKNFTAKLQYTDASSWLAVLGKLVVSAINVAIERNILHAKIPKPVAAELIKERIVEFWEPQQLAINSGILENNNILLTMPTSSGKTLLSTIVSSFSTNSKKTVLISPTRTLTNEIYQKVNNYLSKSNLHVAISTREKTNFDDNLSNHAVLVATYEKFSSLFRRGHITKDEIKTLVVDEAHYISDEDRGIQLEFLIKSLKNHSSAQTQIVGLSGMINKDDAEKFSSWIGGKSIVSYWRPIDLDEMIYFDGNFYHKNQQITTSMIRPNKAQPPEAQRFSIARRLAKDEMDNNRQCMIVIPSRVKVEEQSKKLMEEISGQLSLFPNDNSNSFSQGSKFYSEQIRLIEPELPPFALILSKMVEVGVAYHHAGLPEPYRLLVEGAVRNNVIKILVTTSTLEAGVNLPVSTVIFPNPQAKLGKYAGKMTINKYKNIAGRAGRSGYDRNGKSILVALTNEEKDELFEKYIAKNSESLHSSIHNFLRNVPTARYAIQSEILNILTEKHSVSKDELLNHVNDTWFVQTSDTQQIQKFKNSFSWEIEKLKLYGCVLEGSGKISINNLGKTASTSMLFALSITTIVRNLQRIISYEGEKFDILILSLVGLPWELRSYDDLMDDVKVSKKAEFVEKIIQDDDQLKEKYQRSTYAPKFGTVLWFWISSMPTSEIIKKCELQDTQSAFIEETLKEDAYWILKAISRISNNTIRLKEYQRERISLLADFCKYGSSDPIVKEIMEFNLKHIRRSTALKLAEYFRSKSKKSIKIKDLHSIPKQSILQLFPTNLTSAELLYTEIQSLK